MQWRNVLQSRWAFMAGAIFGAPGVLDNFEFWRKLVGDMSAGWQGVLIGGGGLLILMGLITVISNHWKIIAGEIYLYILIFVAFVALVLAAVIFIDIPTIRWSHPMLSAEEQEKAHADCRMRAVEVIGAGNRPSLSSARERYQSDCLISEGVQARGNL